MMTIKLSDKQGQELNRILLERIKMLLLPYPEAEERGTQMKLTMQIHTKLLREIDRTEQRKIKAEQE